MHRTRLPLLAVILAVWLAAAYAIADDSLLLLMSGGQRYTWLAVHQDANSLVAGDISAPEWQAFNDTYKSTVTADPDGVGWVVNAGLTQAGAYGFNGVRFVAPPGCNTVTATVRVRMVTGDAGRVMRLVIGTYDGTPLATTNITLTDAYADYTATLSGQVAGNELSLLLIDTWPDMASGVQQRFVVSGVSLVPAQGTGVFGAAFIRYDIGRGGLLNSRGTGYHAYGAAYNQSCLATSKFLAAGATELALEYASDITAYYPSMAQVALVENGGSPTQSTAATFDSYPIITRFTGLTGPTFEAIGGLQSYPTGIFTLGTRLRAVYLPATNPARFISQSPLVVAYGDSITVGGNSDVPPLHGWVALVRETVKGAEKVALEGWGYRALHDDAATSGARTTFAAQLANYGAHIYWLAIGTNDYGLEPWTAADFGTAYAATLDAIKVADPQAVIYAQTPIVRSSEVANGLGDTLGAYRTAIATACTGRAFATLVDGTAILAVGDLADGVHPTTAGHAKYAAAVKAILGW